MCSILSYDLHGMLIEVGIFPHSMISAGSRTSIKSFSGWFGKSLTSSYVATVNWSLPIVDCSKCQR